MIHSLTLKTLDHHAYCIVGGHNEHVELTESLSRDHGINIHGNPDYIDRKYGTFDIEDAHTIKHIAEIKPTTSTAKKILILEMAGIGLEAQNALLKVLEEPPVNTHFFIIIPSAHLLLPTVRSRVSFIGERTSGEGRDLDDPLLVFAQKFVKSSTKERLDMAKAFNEDITKEKRTKHDAVELLGILEEITHKKGLKGNVKKFEAIDLARKYSTDRSPSIKMLLDYVAMSL